MIDEITGALSGNNFGPIQDKSSKGVSKDEFLKLLTYQLRAQNPLRPYDNQEFAAQLAQFSQLEQLTQIKSLLEEQINSNYLLTTTISNTALPGLIGKNAKAYSDKIQFDGEKPVNIGLSQLYPAQSGELIIRDLSGNIVSTINLSPAQLAKGDHNITWDGKDRDGNTLAASEYTISAVMKDQKGTSYSADTFINGKIEAVRFKNEGTVLIINGTEVALQDVYDISTEN